MITANQTTANQACHGGVHFCLLPSSGGFGLECTFQLSVSSTTSAVCMRRRKDNCHFGQMRLPFNDLSNADPPRLDIKKSVVSRYLLEAVFPDVRRTGCGNERPVVQYIKSGMLILLEPEVLKTHSHKRPQTTVYVLRRETMIRNSLGDFPNLLILNRRFCISSARLRGQPKARQLEGSSLLLPPAQ